MKFSFKLLIKIIIIIFFKLFVCRASQYHVLQLLANTAPQHTYDTIDPNLVTKYDTTAIRNWTIGNEIVHESTFRVNTADLSDYPVYNFFTIEHGNDKIVFKGKNYGRELEIDFLEKKISIEGVPYFRDGLWHNFILIYARNKGYAEVSWDCMNPIRVEISKGNQTDENLRRIPLIIGIPKVPIQSVDVRKDIIFDEIGDRYKINCDEFLNKFGSQFGPEFKLNAENQKTVITNSKMQSLQTEFFPKIENRFFDEPADVCQNSITTVKGQNICKGQLIFEDSFDFLNWTKWDREIRIALEYEDAAFVSYQDRPENLYINSTNLVITPKLLSHLKGFSDDKIRSGELKLKSSCTGFVDVRSECQRKARNFRILPPIVSAKIRTKSFFSFRYGVVEVRAKLPTGDWIFPQILLEPLIYDYGITGYLSGQIRVAFSRGNEILFDQNGNDIGGKVLYGGAILSDDALVWNKNLRTYMGEESFSNDFHIYSMEWTDRYIKLKIDGKEYGVIEGGFKNDKSIPDSILWGKGNYMAPFDKEFFISLGVSVGGINDFPDVCYNWSWEENAYVGKPWDNTSPKAELNFWRDRSNWYKTWNSNSKMEIDYIRVWAL